MHTRALKRKRFGRTFGVSVPCKSGPSLHHAKKANTSWLYLNHIFLASNNPRDTLRLFEVHRQLHRRGYVSKK